MRVAISTWLHDGAPSGATRRLVSLLSALDPALDVVLLCGPDGPPPGTPEHFEQLRVAIPAVPTRRRVFAEHRRLGPALRHLGADVVDLGAMPVPPRLPCPVVLTLHDLRDLDAGLQRRPGWMTRRVLDVSVRRAAAIVVPSRFTAERLRSSSRVAAIDVVPAGVESTADRRPTSPPFVLHVGHLERRKNLELLLRAHASMSPEFGLVLVGRDAGSEFDLRQLAEQLQTSARIRWEGVVSEARLAELYATTHAVAVPSRHEGFGLPALEAMAAAAPVVVSNCGALPEVVGEPRCVVDVDDVDGWARTLERPPEPPPPRAEHRPAAQAAAMLDVWRRVSSRPA